jgi:hypothetical protein
MTEKYDYCSMGVGIEEHLRKYTELVNVRNFWNEVFTFLLPM